MKRLEVVRWFGGWVVRQETNHPTLSQPNQSPQIYDEKTLVVRLIYDLHDPEVEVRIYELAREIITMTQSQEEEI